MTETAKKKTEAKPSAPPSPALAPEIEKRAKLLKRKAKAKKAAK